MTKKKVHFMALLSNDRTPACGADVSASVTCDANSVTCGRCWRTYDFRFMEDMMTQRAFVVSRVRSGRWLPGRVIRVDTLSVGMVFRPAGPATAPHPGIYKVVPCHTFGMVRAERIGHWKRGRYVKAPKTYLSFQTRSLVRVTRF